jgi:hypothetical protein
MKVINRICFLIAIFVFTVCLPACSSNLAEKENTKISNAKTNKFDIAAFERNRELWTSKNIKNYKMVIGAKGGMINFPEQVLIEVQNSRSKSIKSLSETDGNYIEKYYKPFDTVEKLFDLIESAKKRNAETLNVRYEEAFGYPSRIYIDQDSKGSDDELLLVINKFEVIK